MIQHEHWIWTPLMGIIQEFAGLEIVNGELKSDPLDGDDTEELLDILRIKINFHQGNITEEEYHQQISELSVLGKVPIGYCPKCAEPMALHENGCVED